jgi:hypothetical protein
LLVLLLLLELLLLLHAQVGLQTSPCREQQHAVVPTLMNASQ